MKTRRFRRLLELLLIALIGASFVSPAFAAEEKKGGQQAQQQDMMALLGMAFAAMQQGQMQQQPRAAAAAPKTDAQIAEELSRELNGGRVVGTSGPRGEEKKGASDVRRTEARAATGARTETKAPSAETKEALVKLGAEVIADWSLEKGLLLSRDIKVHDVPLEGSVGIQGPKDLIHCGACAFSKHSRACLLDKGKDLKAFPGLLYAALKSDPELPGFAIGDLEEAGTYQAALINQDALAVSAHRCLSNPLVQIGIAAAPQAKVGGTPGMYCDFVNPKLAGTGVKLIDMDLNATGDVTHLKDLIREKRGSIVIKLGEATLGDLLSQGPMGPMVRALAPSAGATPELLGLVIPQLHYVTLVAFDGEKFYLVNSNNKYYKMPADKLNAIWRYEVKSELIKQFFEEKGYVPGSVVVAED